ncbi:uncharacterized protein LOC115446692 [Manduca sexta]|uniref:Uncharacterized protein n=1 Tax=Manduca sexta TaxID=7130 RepID=A0A922CQV7_MANSE|nr:uncharacterized protein LOC115446692 [Manduca sexta]KAG6455122.1 hypothetical protein O3G_MSEX009038 [Manduca sexta]
MPAGKLIMTSKRKRDDVDRKVKRKRGMKRARSEPLSGDSENSEKRQALRRLFGRGSSAESENNQQRLPDDEDDFDPRDAYIDENDDPLLDSVPVDMDPEQLGFLVCAQETLRFLHGRGVPVEHPVFSRLRSRLLRGMDEIAMA